MYKTGKMEIIETLVDTYIFVRNTCNRDVEDGKIQHRYMEIRITRIERKM